MRRVPGLAEFPDTVTARGAKHLGELADMVREGHRAVMVYLVQRGDCDRLKLCRDLDPAYCAAFDRAASAGVEAFAIRCQITQNEIIPEKTIPVEE
jgi:sugar fermentation stimulation protein A